MSLVIPPQIDNSLAVAWRALWRAALAAETLRDQGLADDIHSIRLELERVRGTRAHPRLPAHPELFRRT